MAGEVRIFCPICLDVSWRNDRLEHHDSMVPHEFGVERIVVEVDGDFCRFQSFELMLSHLLEVLGAHVAFFEIKPHEDSVDLYAKIAHDLHYVGGISRRCTGHDVLIPWPRLKELREELWSVGQGVMEVDPDID